MARNRSTPEKIRDWTQAYEAIRGEITPPELRGMQALFNGTIKEATTPAEGIALLQQSMALARLIAGNDRAAALAASMLTAGGGARPVPLEQEDV